MKISSKSELRNKISEETIQYYKEHQSEITYELLDALRKQGNDGKQIALEILDMPKSSNGYYLDAYGERISNNGNRSIKSKNTSLNLSQIHLDEISKCQDIFYFLENYVKLVTKSGIDFPELREYQTNFIDKIIDDANIDLCSLAPRQSGKTVTVGIYLTHCAIFKRDINIGICANRGKTAKEFLDKVKKIYVELPIWLQTGIVTWNKTWIETENGVRMMSDVFSETAFRGFSCHMIVADEAAFTSALKWHEFSDSTFPSQGALSWRKNILLSTANGKNHFYHIIEGARKKKNGFTIHEVNWRDVPRYNIDGTLKDPDIFKDEIINKYGELYFAQNYSNDFLGSSNTMIDSSVMANFKPQEVLERLQPGLKIYEQPIKGHKYIMAIDASKDGDDYFGIQIVDTENMSFRQVASGRLQVEYLLMPEYIFNWATYYENAYVIIENNEGAGQSIADTLKITYEYENLYYDMAKDTKIKNLSKLKKKYPGFRTNVKTRKQILSLLKIFIEAGNLELFDKETIDEFDTFILIDGKYQAESGYHDDMVMSLALVFAPFVNTKNIIDMKALVNTLFKTSSESGEENIQISQIISSCSFDDGTPSSVQGFEDHEMMYIRHQGGFF